MPINMTDYKMILHDKVYNVLQIMIDFGEYYVGREDKEQPPKPKFIDAVYVNEDGNIEIVRDEAWCFQFIRRTERERKCQ